jgi:hypothetical protein
MQHWRKDEGFAGVRGEKALTPLPEAERADWHKRRGGSRDTPKTCRAKAEVGNLGSALKPLGWKE